MNINYKEVVRSKVFSGFIFGLGTVLILAIVFQAGMYVGLKKANFSQRLGENYGRIFGDERRPALPGGMFDGMPFDNLPGGHGAAGIVVKVSSSTLVVAEPNNIEKIVLIGEKTIIRRFQDQIKSTDIITGDFVSILGEANDKGEIEAKLVRVLPTPPAASSTIKTN